jgi:Holliday junction resolvase RusA-like endonuclease
MNGSLFPQLEPLREEMERGPGVISFTVYGIAKSQGRPTASPVYRKGPDGRPQPVIVDGRVITNVHQPAEVKTWRNDVRLAAGAATDGKHLQGPLVLHVAFFLPRPGRLVWKTRPMPTEPCDRKPDLDNLVKGIKDALSGCLWRDDSQVVEIHATKRYAAGPGYGDERARVEVTVEAIS